MRKHYSTNPKAKVKHLHPANHQLNLSLVNLLILNVCGASLKGIPLRDTSIVLVTSCRDFKKIAKKVSLLSLQNPSHQQLSSQHHHHLVVSLGLLTVFLVTPPLLFWLHLSHHLLVLLLLLCHLLIWFLILLLLFRV